MGASVALKQVITEVLAAKGDNFLHHLLSNQELTELKGYGHQ